MSTLRLSVRLQVSETAPGAARHALDGLDLYVGEELCRTIKLLVSELVTNSIRHADLRPDDTIDVVVTATDDVVRVEVGDPGEGFIDEVREPRPDQASGWGLLLTDRLANRWGVSGSDGTNVWFEVTHNGGDGTSTEDHQRQPVRDLDPAKIGRRRSR
jgi:anti-sigma regulatory factor (Ser/Thr protein kinase)